MITRRLGNNLLKKLNITTKVGQHRQMLHVKNLVEEHQRAQNQYDQENSDTVETYDRIYKPSYTIEFDRNGECLLYSCEPLKHTQVYLKYPYVLYESLIPACLWTFYMNPMNLDWHWSYAFLGLANVLWFPRVWYFKNLQYRLRRMHMLRGGKFVKVEMGTLAGDRVTAWAENRFFHPLTEDAQHFDDRDEGDFLTEEGQLNYELTVQLENFTEKGVTSQDQLFYFMKEGVVHHPEIFEAVIKGFHVDTSDYCINTAHNMRAFEGIHSI